MTTRRRTGRGGARQNRSSGTRRQPRWLDTLPDESVANNTQQQDSLLEGLTTPDTRGLTIMRMLVHLRVGPITPSAVIGTQKVDVGVALVSADAFSAAALPDPQVAGDRPVMGWLWRDQFQVVDEQAAGFARTAGFQEVRLDLRGRRRIIGTSELVLIMNNSNIEGTAFSIRVSGIIRCLALLA